MQTKYLYSLGLASAVTLLTACGGGSSSHTPVSVASSSATLSSSNAASSSIAYTEPTTALTLPASLEVVTNENIMAAAGDTASDYVADSQRYHVWNESLKPIELVNSILCFTGQFKANEFVNAGPYIALADEKACFKNEDGGDASAQSAGAANTPTYMKVVVNATRGTDITSPIIVSVWMPEMGSGEDLQAIKFKAVIKKGASAENPFGSFTFNYDMFDSFTAMNSMGQGEIQTVTIANKIGFTLFENESEEGRTSTKNASVVMSTDRSTGVALTSNHQSDGFGDRGNAFGLAFNASNVLLQTADSYANLPFMPNNDASGSQSCLSRTAFDETVNRYDLYDSTSGARLELKSGLSFKYDSDDADTDADSFGHIGYWGVWTEKPNTLVNGAVIQVDTPGSQATTEYTVVQAPGRLIKNTVEELPLADAKGIEFSYWSADAQEHNYQSWVVEYLTTDDNVEVNGFYKTGGSRQGNDGPEVVSLESPILITPINDQPLQMNSQQLGGNVKYKFGADVLMFFKQEFINGSETAAEELFAAGAATLYCIERCPVGTLGATELASWDTPYSPRATTNDNAIAFTISNNGNNALALVRTSNSQIVKYSGVTEQGLTDAHSPYSWGIRSGSLITAETLATLTDVNQINDPTKVTVFYEWETGLNSFNQTTSIKDSHGVIQTFDKPIQIKYTHSSDNDRSGNAGAFNNKVVMLNYGGNGELWGIPYKQSDDGRSQPQFSIKDGTILGGQYKIKAREIEGTMQDASGHCDNLLLSQPDAAVPTAITGNGADIGDMPTVDTAPRVIGGVIQVAP